MYPVRWGYIPPEFFIPKKILGDICLIPLPSSFRPSYVSYSVDSFVDIPKSQTANLTNTQPISTTKSCSQKTKKKYCLKAISGILSFHSHLQHSDVQLKRWKGHPYIVYNIHSFICSFPSSKFLPFIQFHCISFVHWSGTTILWLDDKKEGTQKKGKKKLFSLLFDWFLPYCCSTIWMAFNCNLSISPYLYNNR